MVEDSDEEEEAETVEVEATDDGGDDSDGEAAKRPRVLPEAGELLRVYWTCDRVWFRCRVVSRLASEARVDYFVQGWAECVHDLASTTWERWEEGGPIDPGEAEYDGEQWLGERDVLAERAARVAQEAEGGRGERAAARAAARKRRAEGERGAGSEKRVRGGAG